MKTKGFFKYIITKINHGKNKGLNFIPNIIHMKIKDKNVKCVKQKCNWNFILITYEIINVK